MQGTHWDLVNPDPELGEVVLLTFGPGAVETEILIDFFDDGVPATNRLLDFEIDLPAAPIAIPGSAVVINVTHLPRRDSMRMVITEATTGGTFPTTWAWENGALEFDENEAPFLTRARVIFSAPLPADVTMRIRTVDGTGVAGVDYVAIDATPTLTAGSTQFSVPFQIIDNSTVPSMVVSRPINVPPTPS